MLIVQFLPAGRHHITHGDQESARGGQFGLVEGRIVATIRPISGPKNDQPSAIACASTITSTRRRSVLSGATHHTTPTENPEPLTHAVLDFLG